MLYLIITLVALVVYTYTKWDTISPKLIVREAATLTGLTVGATPELLRTGTKMVKAANAKTELELRQAGSEGPIGFREGTVIAKKATRDTLRPYTAAADLLLKESLAELDKLNSNKS